MKLHYHIIFIIILAASNITAQSPSKILIQNSGDYYYGIALHRDMNEAQKLALKNLTQQIGVMVKNDEKYIRDEIGGALNEQFTSTIETYAAVTLVDVNYINTPKNDGTIESICYIKKSQVYSIFDQRRRLIKDINLNAEKYASERNIADALKYYYYSFLLLLSLPETNFRDGDINYTTLIPMKINELMDNVGFNFVYDKFISDDEREITLRVTFKGEPISFLDFYIWDGIAQTKVSAKDGLATFPLFGGSVNMDQIKVTIKYEYPEHKSEFKPVDLLWDMVKHQTFGSSVIVKFDLEQSQQTTSQELAVQSDENIASMSKEIDSTVAEKIGQEINTLFDILQKRSVQEVQSAYASDPFLKEKISSYIRYNRPEVLDKGEQFKLELTKNGWEIRHIRVLHSYPSLNKKVTEYLVLDFTETGQLFDLNVCVSDYLYNKFVNISEYAGDWDNRREIIKFLEKYRTAYLTRDVNTIDKMFAEEALIIVGRLIQKKKLPEDAVKFQSFGNQPGYDYLRMTKKEYLERQKRVFSQQQDISLQFSTFDIVRKGEMPIYGLQMRQSYASTTYADEGHLFLLIDFQTPDPLIYVRAWQPNEWSKEQMINAANFKVWGDSSSSN